MMFALNLMAEVDGPHQSTAGWIVIAIAWFVIGALWLVGRFLMSSKLRNQHLVSRPDGWKTFDTSGTLPDSNKT